jgi:hypothetical protein
MSTTCKKLMMFDTLAQKGRMRSVQSLFETAMLRVMVKIRPYAEKTRIDSHAANPFDCGSDAARMVWRVGINTGIPELE